MTQGCSPSDVVSFWQQAGPKRWFARDEAFDADFRQRFIAAHEAAAAGRLDGWSASAEGALGLVLLLDQFPRNAFRGSPRMYATDAKARSVAGAAIEAGLDRRVPDALRPFFYVPFMHSERLEDQQRSAALNEDVGGESLRFARHHRDIVARFGRFPHRNAILGRASTPEEEAFLRDGGFAG